MQHSTLVAVYPSPWCKLRTPGGNRGASKQNLTALRAECAGLPHSLGSDTNIVTPFNLDLDGCVM